ncbi:hypothetical protein [Aquabacter spiritensis]|uniref:Thioesterase domain-containing protein n=1 Tax=Aquabacter spiritensis TaxID=933073 RepID=A0A4R3M268_9HYPH|nr:hypothetical protein [Aquabacter spiritensis]TCT06786.1 hypothetical protein EDC64_102266 [Aquabacter spiritensis]
MKAGLRLVGALVAALAFLLPASFSVASAQSIGKVYLMRGLANVFSQGMDDLGAKLRARGIDAEVYEHGRWPALADQAVSFAKTRGRPPVIIIGHSLGADAAIKMAERMTDLGVSPRLVVTFDPVGVTEIGRTSGRFINYYQSNNGFGKRLETGPGFRGQLVNRNLDDLGAIDHFNIEKSPKLHAEVIAAIVSVTRPRRPKPAPAPDIATQAAPAAMPASADTTSASAVHAVSKPALQ